MNKKTILAILTTALICTACKNGKTEPANTTDSTTVETSTPGTESSEDEMHFATYFNTIKLGMTAEEVSNAMATLPEEGFVWEGLHLNFDFEEMSFDDDNRLRAIIYRTEFIGTGEYMFIGEGKWKLYALEDGAVSYENLGKLLERFAAFAEKELDCFTADCGMQSYSAMGKDDAKWAGSIEIDYFNAPRREAIGPDGSTIEVGHAFLKFSITTPEDYAG